MVINIFLKLIFIINWNLGKEKLNLKNTNYISGNIIRLYCDKILGFIVNETSCILEIPNNLEIKDSDDDIKKIGKNIRKNIPKISVDILNNGLNLKSRKITNPESINILNFEGFHSVSV